MMIKRLRLQREGGIVKLIKLLLQEKEERDSLLLDQLNMNVYTMQATRQIPRSSNMNVLHYSFTKIFFRKILRSGPARLSCSNRLVLWMYVLCVIVATAGACLNKCWSTMINNIETQKNTRKGIFG